MKLYGVARSRASRVLWAAGELGVALEMVPTIQAYRLEARGIDPLGAAAPFNTRSPAFLEISPAGAVPVLVDGDLVLGESLAITQYLAARSGGPIAPQTLEESAQVAQWALFGATAIEPDALALQTLHGRGAQDAAALAGHRAALARPLRVLEAHLARRGHMVGGRFTVADVNMAEIVRYGAGDAPLMAAHPQIAAWLARCHERPAFRAMWTRREAEPA